MLSKIVITLLLALSCHIGFKCNDKAVPPQEQSSKVGKQIDVIITTNDIIALGAQKAVRDNGLIIPDDIKISGMGNTYIAEIAELSSINCKHKEISDAAVSTINAILNNTPSPTRITFPAEIIKRGTLK